MLCFVLGCFRGFEVTGIWVFVFGDKGVVFFLFNELFVRRLVGVLCWVFVFERRGG